MPQTRAVDPSSLDERIEWAGGPVNMLRNAQVGAFQFPIRPEYTNWRDEQRSWRSSASLMDSSFHMTDFHFKGPGLHKLLADTGINSFASFARDHAKQFVACNHEGFLIGDCILMALDDDSAVLVGRPTVPHWVAFQAETGNYDVEVSRDYQTSMNPNPRRLFRFQVQGPNAHSVLQDAARAPVDVPFFRVGHVEIAGVPVRALNHSMSRAVGLELTGPFDAATRVRDALLDAGRDFDLKQIGGRAYAGMALESGWIPSAMPAIFSGAGMKEFRDWLGPNAWEGHASLGGSFYSDRIEDYYLTPWNLGLDRVMRFDHDFIGRQALEQKASETHRRKVWLRWNDDDFAKILVSSLWGGDSSAKYPEQPNSNYSTLPYDRVMSGTSQIGVSTLCGYSVNVGGWLSLAVVDAEYFRDGAEVSVVWGEEGGGSAKPTVERHVQSEFRATVSTKPLL